MLVQGFFIFGFDNEDTRIFATAESHIRQIGLEDALLYILTPYPGTPIYDQLKREGQLLVSERDKYGWANTPLTDGNSYFHIRTRDNAGNWNASASHSGPFYIDTNPPGNPTSANPGCTASNNTWQNTCGDPNFTWSGATDSGSGIAGYYVYWGTDPSGTSSTWVSSPAYNPPAVSSPSTYYLRLQTRDNVGWTSNWTTLFTFTFDASAPSNPTTVTSSSHTRQSGRPIPPWMSPGAGASDGAGSGVNGYSIQWSTASTTLPDTSVDTTGTSVTSTSQARSTLVLGDRCSLRLS